MLLRKLVRTITKGKKIDVELSKIDTHLLPKDVQVPKATTINGDELLKMHEEMYICRRLESSTDLLYKSRKVRGFCHLYDGQESVAVGMEHALNYEDAVITAYRNHCNAYLRGIPLYNIICELTGRKDGCSRGRGGSMHLYGTERNFYGGW